MQFETFITHGFDERGFSQGQRENAARNARLFHIILDGLIAELAAVRQQTVEDVKASLSAAELNDLREKARIQRDTYVARN